MEFKLHTKKRYLERIAELTDEQEIKIKLSTEDERITEHLNKLYEFSRLIYVGQINGDKVTRNYYLNRDVIMVGDTNRQFIQTLYKVDFKFPEDWNLKTIDRLVEELDKLYKDLDDIKEVINRDNETKIYEIEELDGEIKLLRERLEILEFNKKVVKDEITANHNKCILIHKKIDEHGCQLCNSLGFSKDLKNGLL